MTEGDTPAPTAAAPDTPSPAPAKKGAKKDIKKGAKKKRSGLGTVLFAAAALAAAVGAWWFLGQQSRPVLPGNTPAVNLPAQHQPAAPQIRQAPDTAALSILSARLEAVETKLATLPQEPGDAAMTGALTARADDLERRLAALESKMQGAANLDHTAVSLGFALGRLRAAVFEGRPYGADLDRVSRLIASAGQVPSEDALARMAAALDQLRDRATSGVPTVEMLRAEFGATAPAILSEQSDGGWTGDLRARLASLVTVRRTGEIAGDHPEARVARAETRLGDGDLVAAVQELAALDGRAAEAAGSWLANARARLTAERALRALDAAGADIIAGSTSGGAG